MPRHLHHDRRRAAPIVILISLLLLPTAVIATETTSSVSPPSGSVEGEGLQSSATLAGSALTDSPCPPAPPVPEGWAEVSRQILKPGLTLAMIHDLVDRPDFKAYSNFLQERGRNDWAGLCQYAADDAALKHAPHIIFFGDSITGSWVYGDPALFGPGVIGRGVGGQTTVQMLLRFFQDVIDLHPQAVHILAGTNDLAGNTGASSPRDYQHNIRAMVDLAQVHHIRVVLASMLPAAAFPWKPDLRPAADIMRMNRWLRNYATARHIAYVDYYGVLSDRQGGMRAGLSYDGVHPNENGYREMHSLAMRAIARAKIGVDNNE
jgi:lysophospholipase L1-like esterase